jgi:hypothetical protein
MYPSQYTAMLFLVQNVVHVPARAAGSFWFFNTTAHMMMWIVCTLAANERCSSRSLNTNKDNLPGFPWLDVVSISSFMLSQLHRRIWPLIRLFTAASLAQSLIGKAFPLQTRTRC